MDQRSLAAQGTGIGRRPTATRQRHPDLRSARARRDERLAVHIKRVWEANLRVYGTDKIWKQMDREAFPVARCTVERLMRRLGLQGARQGKRVRTTVPDRSAPCPRDRVNRQFTAERPNQLWVSAFTYVSTWQGWLHVAFVIDVFARRIVGWRVSRIMTTDFVLDALEQALYARQPADAEALVHYSERGSQYVFLRYTIAWPRPASNPRWAAAATVTTTPWPRPSTGCTRPS